MVEGKPYRYGLIAAGLCVAAVGLFIMTQERPHIYGTMCVLGVSMVCVGTVWSFCQCYPKVILAPVTQETDLDDLVHASTGAEEERMLSTSSSGRNGDSSSLMCLRHAEALPGFCGQKWSSSRLLPEAQKSRCHSCPTLHLV